MDLRLKYYVMDITFISDMYGLHDRLKLNAGTILLYAGEIVYAITIFFVIPEVSKPAQSQLGLK